ncbi:MAG TPA: MlaD family protein [Solirubrobacteraceae bacterium]
MRGPISGWRAHVAWSALAIAFATAFALFLFRGAGTLPEVGDEYRVRAVLPAAGGLAARSRVTIAGVDVGDVERVERRGAGVVVELSLDDDHAPVARDSRVVLRQRTLLGEKYLQIVPGRARARVPDGGLLGVEQANEFVEVDDVLSQLRGRTRRNAQQAIRSLGLAVGDRGRELNRVVDGTSAMITTGAPVVASLARERRHITRLVANLGDLATEIGDRGLALRTLGAQATAAFGAVAGQDRALRATLEQLPSTLNQVRATSGVLRTTTRTATPVVGRLATAVDGLRPVVRRLEPAARDTGRVLDALGAAAPGLTRTVGALRRVSPPAVRAFPQLRKVLCQLNPLLRYVAPYDRELAAVITGLGSAVNSYDANGHLARLFIGAGPSSLLALPPAVAKAQNELLQTGVLQKIHLLGYNPYPAPGKANDDSVGRNSIGPADAENRYVRVQADC